ncbi:MAG TPA: transglycosylase SLT domain-containing protein [Casimicrobiaceae bacterium]|jgi:SLT domain-containing protein
MLTAAQIYTLARAAGFPPVVAVTMTAIALRESSGNPNAFNGDAQTGDRSYGLWQINMAGTLSVPRMKAFGINAENKLLDPATNAHAAFVLWNRSNKNLSTCWYIDHPGMYQTRYESHLPAAQAAAIAAAMPAA